MKINEHILSIPPYISTSWLNVAALKMEGTSLVVILNVGHLISIPGLDSEIIANIFEQHKKALESKPSIKAQGLPMADGFVKQADQAFRFGMGGMEVLGNAMQHSFEMRNAPSLPQEILNKVEAVARVIAPDMQAELPKAEPHCNCPHCQIARAMQRGLGEKEELQHPTEVLEEQDESVPPEELQFEEWRIEQTGYQLFTVINKIDAIERYSVFLGNPVGCTCGKQGCDHILAVLRS